MFVTNALIMEHIGRKPEYQDKVAELEAQRDEIDRTLSMMRATLAYLDVGEIYEQVALRVEEFENGAIDYTHLGEDSARGARIRKEAGVWHVRLFDDFRVGSLRDSVIMTDKDNARHAAKEWVASGRVFKERGNESTSKNRSDRRQAGAA